MRPSDPIIIEEMSSPVNRIVSSGALLSHQSLEPKCWAVALRTPLYIWYESSNCPYMHVVAKNGSGN